MTLGSLFDGSGGFPLAGMLNGIEPVWASEIEPYPIAVTRSRFPNMKHLGSVTEINGGEIEPVDIITFGSPCLPAGTLINTVEGLKPIENITVADKVLTHTGAYKQVLDSQYTGTKRVLKLRAMGIDELEATPNHRFYARTKKCVRDNDQLTDTQMFSEPQWIELGQLRCGDLLGIPIIQEQDNSLGLTSEECWLIGRYIADGYIRDQQRPDRPDGSKFNTVVYCVGNVKQTEFESHLTMHKAGKSCDKNVVKYSIHESRLRQLCAMCGKGAENKVFPQPLLNLPTELLEAVIDGYISGDGCYTGGYYKATTVSRDLAYSLGAAVAKVYHVPYRLYCIDVPDTTVIEGRVVKQKPQYQVVFKKEKRERDKAFYERERIWVPINDIISVETKKPVYDLTIAEDHSFCALNIAVHNCQDLSANGSHKGLHNGARSSLFFQAIRIIKEMRNATNGRYPRYAVWENVAGAFSSCGGNDFRCVLEEFCNVCGDYAIPRPKNGRWKHAGEIVGDNFSIAWRLFDARYWGVPQVRKRIYLVADFTGQSGGGILFEQESMPRYFEKGDQTLETNSGSIERCF